MPKRKLYWDACVFIALLTNEERPGDEMARLMEVVEMADREEVIIVTSVMTNTEVLDDDESGTFVRGQLDLLFKRPNFVRAALTSQISTLGGELREGVKKLGQNLKTPDATHLATALTHRVHELHTFDPDLLRYNGKEVARGLRICAPRGRDQTELDLFKTSA